MADVLANQQAGWPTSHGWRTGNWPIALAAAAFLFSHLHWLVGLKRAVRPSILVLCLMAFTHSSAFPSMTRRTQSGGQFGESRANKREGQEDGDWGTGIILVRGQQMLPKMHPSPIYGWFPSSLPHWERGLKNPIDGSTSQRHTNHLRWWQLFPPRSFAFVGCWSAKAKDKSDGVC